MSKRIGLTLGAFAAGLVGLMGGPAAALQDAPKAPKWIYAYDLRVRTGGTKNFDAKTPRIGVEFFLDVLNEDELALSETGFLAVAPGTAIGPDKKVEWITAHDMRTRKAGETEFSKATRLYGVEVFKDLAANRLLYVSEVGGIAFAPLPASLGTDKGPKWHHAMEPKVRGPEEETFEKAKKIGVEVFKDENTGGLVYITEAGALATAPAPPAPPEKNKIKDPKPLYGLVLQVRKSDEPDFTENTRRVGIEVFEDPNAGGELFYLSDTGSIATAPKPDKFNDARGVIWKGAMNLKARKGGEKDFEKAAKYGLEVFLDNKTGYLVYICQTGAIAVLAK